MTTGGHVERPTNRRRDRRRLRKLRRKLIRRVRKSFRDNGGDQQSENDVNDDDLLRRGVAGIFGGGEVSENRPTKAMLPTGNS